MANESYHIVNYKQVEHQMPWTIATDQCTINHWAPSRNIEIDCQDFVIHLIETVDEAETDARYRTYFNLDLAVSKQPQLHGLLGQTWKESSTIIEGQVQQWRIS